MSNDIMKYKVQHSKGKANRTIMNPDGRPIATVLPCKDEQGHHHAKDHADMIVDALNGERWVIWSNEHDAWWRSNHCGYTTLFSDAGLYTYADAVMICAGANWGQSGDGDMDRDGRARSRQGRPMETMLPAQGCYGKVGNRKHPDPKEAA